MYNYLVSLKWKDMGEARRILGMKIERDGEGESESDSESLLAEDASEVSGW